MIMMIINSNLQIQFNFYNYLTLYQIKLLYQTERIVHVGFTTNYVYYLGNF